MQTHTQSHIFSVARNELGDNDNLRTLDLETETVETEQEIATVGGTSDEPDSIDIGDD